jgi:DNA-binding LacI/PurR family transcriptional regulator
MSITIKELASMLKISPATVSLALNGDKRVADKTVKKVKKLASELNYIPNNFGRGLQSRRSHLIGYLLDGVTSSFYNELLQGVGEACSKAQYGLLTGILGKKEENLKEQVNIFLEKNIDGLLLSLQAPEEVISSVKKQNIPFVFCSTPPENPDYTFVKNNDFEGGKMAAEHLINLGHRSFALSSIQSERLKGNLNVLRKNGFREVLFEKESELEAIMSKAEHPTAIIAYSDLEAIKIRHLLNKLGLRVPQDVSIIGTDDLWFASLPEFSFTTIAQPKKRIGETSVELLLKKINGKKVESMYLNPELIVRQSTSAPAKK